MTLAIIVCLLVCLFGWLGVSIGLGIRFTESQITLANGQLTGVDQCDADCHGDEVCANVPDVSIQWTFDNLTFTAHNFSTNVCGDCCYSMVNQSIKVKIDPQNASIPLFLYPVDEYPFNTLYLFCLIFTSFFTYASCVTCILFFREKEKSQYQSF